jgi:uncharacterized membrane protein
VNTWTRRSTKHDRVTPLLDGNEAGHLVLGMSVRSFLSVSKDFASASDQAHIQVLASHSRLRPLVLCVLFWRFMVLQTRILPGVGWIGSPLLGLTSFWDLLWCLGFPANSRVLLNHYRGKVCCRS